MHSFGLQDVFILAVVLCRILLVIGTYVIIFAFYHLRRIRQIWQFVDNRSLQLLVHTFITSRLDYCNGLLANCCVVVRQRLQRIQNSATRLVCSEPAFSHAATLLHWLHWFPVARRIKYKLCVLMFDVFHGTAPAYLTDLCSRCTDHRLRSQPAATSLCDEQGHGSPTARSLSQDPLPGKLTSGSHPHDWLALCVLQSLKNLSVHCSWLDLTVTVLYYYCIFSFYFYFILTAFCKALLSTGWGPPSKFMMIYDVNG